MQLPLNEYISLSITLIIYNYVRKYGIFYAFTI
jgi:hypothetical protein